MAKKTPPPTFKPIKPTRAHEAILAQLQRKILERELAPGDRMPSEREMMDTFGVSRPVNILTFLVVHTGEMDDRLSIQLGGLVATPADPRARLVAESGGVAQSRLRRSLPEAGSWLSRDEYIAHVTASWPEYNRLCADPFEWT